MSTVIITAPKVSVFADSDMMSEATSMVRHQENIPTFNAPSPAKNLAWGPSASTVTSTPSSKSTTEHTPVPDIVMSSSLASKSKDAVSSVMPTAHTTAPVTPPLTPAVTMPRPAQPPVSSRPRAPSVTRMDSSQSVISRTRAPSVTRTPSITRTPSMSSSSSVSLSRGTRALTTWSSSKNVLESAEKRQDKETVVARAGPVTSEVSSESPSPGATGPGADNTDNTQDKNTLAISSPVKSLDTTKITTAEIVPTPVSDAGLSLTASASTSSSDNPKYDMSQRVFRYFLKLRLEEENIAVNTNTDLSEDFKSAVQSILDRLTRFKARIRLWRLATEVNLEKLTKDTLRSLFWKIFESSNYIARWILLFFFLTDLIILVLKRRPSLEENLILWSTDLVREGISPFARENGGWKYFLFLTSDCNIRSESQNEDTTDLYGSFKWKPQMIKTLKQTMKAALLQYKNLRANQRNGYKKIWTEEFTKCLPSFNVKNKTRFLRAKYVGSKKHQRIQKAMSKKFLKYLKLTVQTLLTRKETTTCEEILTFLKETKQKELQMEYPVKNVKRSIRRAMDNFSRTGSTSLKRPGRPPMSETLREKIITLSRNKRYRR